ncbi:MAG: hypothetical protein QOE53_3170 [Pseudonocardiales bacterium]|nr:hypothetical protein [Pseudonocardiales bacterium]
MKLSTHLLIPFLACIFVGSALAQAEAGPDPDWSKLLASMDKMHMAIGAIGRSGNDDVDFVRLMLPHHQAAVDMARAQLLYGKDPQMRELAQKIISDQESEIGLMQGWLKEQEPAQVEINPTPSPNAAKGN